MEITDIWRGIYSRYPTVTVHLVISRDLWNLITELIYTQTSMGIYDEAKHYPCNKLTAAVVHDVKTLSELPFFNKDTFLEATGTQDAVMEDPEEEDC